MIINFIIFFFFFFQAEDGIRDRDVTGVQTCALPISFANRTEAGRLLAEKLVQYAGRDDVVVLGLPRGGVPVAYEVAKRLRAPLNVFIVRKLGVPGVEELAAGAIASG